jgi:Ca-activated chloride channel family protein
MKTIQRPFVLLALASVLLSHTSLLAQSLPPVRIEKGVRVLLDLETPLDSGSTREGDPIHLRLRHDIWVEDRLALPREARILGTAFRVKPAMVNGKSRSAEIQILLTKVLLSNGRTLAIDAEVVKLHPESVGAPSGGGLQVGLPGILLGGAFGGRVGMAVATAAVIGIGKASQPKPKGADVVLFGGAILETRLTGPLEIPDPSLAGPAAAAAPTPVSTSAPPSHDAGTVASAAAGMDPARAGILDPSSASTPGDAPKDAAPLPDAGPPPGAEIPATSTTATNSTAGTPATTNLGAGAFTIRVNVRLVQMDAVIQDRNGKPLTTVQQEDFRIFDDGVEQQIQVFSRDELPLAVALVIDRSGSVAPLMNRIQAAAYRALRHLKSTDRVSLFSFAADIALLEPLTHDLNRVAHRIGGIQGGGGTRIVDAVNEALDYLNQAAPDQRKAVILISDNLEGSSYATLDQTVQHALETEAVVYSIKINTNPAVPLMSVPVGIRLPGAGTQNRAPGRYDPVPTIAKETGGEVFDASASEVDGALATAVTRLKLRYTMGYYPSRSARGRYHGVEIRLADRFGRPGIDYTVLSRRGYYE